MDKDYTEERGANSGAKEKASPVSSCPPPFLILLMNVIISYVQHAGFSLQL